MISVSEAVEKLHDLLGEKLPVEIDVFSHRQGFRISIGEGRGKWHDRPRSGSLEEALPEVARMYREAVNAA